MKTPRYSDVGEEPLATDEKLVERAEMLLEHALRRQIWLMFLDDESRQLPVIMPTYVPARPGPRESEGFGRFLRELVDDFGAASVAITFERRGGDSYDEADRAWFRLIHDACVSSDVPLRGPMLCHNTGVRWVAAEDYAIG
jgi:hypothetical protein